MTTRSSSHLKRPRQHMPDFVEKALKGRRLMEAYRARRPYQRNDYLWWINSAKRDATKEKRLGPMLAELAAGDSYMNMRYRPSDG